MKVKAPIAQQVVKKQKLNEISARPAESDRLVSGRSRVQIPLGAYIHLKKWLKCKI